MLGCCELPARPVRRSSWLVSALSLHSGCESSSVDNEIVVLATGVDQYLQEIFHHLDCEGDGLVSGEDFRLLCSVLALPEEEDGQQPFSRLPEVLTFKQFHTRLCEPFQRRGEEGAAARLPVARETEHIERQIRLRCPRRRRRKKCVSFDLSRGWAEKPPVLRRGEPAPPLPGAAESPLELENASLRELVEDLRGALQSSDARCLALQVGLLKAHGSLSGQKEQRRAAGTENPAGSQRDRGLRSLLRELELVRSSRDGQINEAMRLNQNLEEELREAHCLLGHWEQSLSALKAGNAQIRERAERATAALLGGLEKVKELENRAKQVPELQNRIQELGQELELYREEQSSRNEVFSCVPTGSEDERKQQQKSRARASPGKETQALPNHSPHFQKYCRSSQSNWVPSCQQTRSPPSGKADSVSDSGEYCSWRIGDCSQNEDEMRSLRAVEGRAASDEEEERSTQTRQCQITELHRDSCNGEGRCHTTALQRHLPHNCSCDPRKSGSMVFPTWMEREQELTEQLKNKEKQVTELQIETEKLTCSMTKELQLKGEEVEMLSMELQMVETDRVRLSLIEEKLTDVLQLLQQLRVLNISRRVLGKILMNTLDFCYNAGHGTMDSLDMLRVLHKELLSCELLTKGSSQSESQQVMKNSLVISC